MLDWTPITLIGTAVRDSEWTRVLNGATTSAHLVRWYIITALCEIIRG